MGYTKLFSEIVTSTVWREPHHVRVVWITMLALRNKYDKVEASLPGLAHLAYVTLEECQEAIKTLSEPDPYSRSHEAEGRRIEACDGGWFIINAEKYRNKLSIDDRNEYQRIKQREYRRKKKESFTESFTEESTDVADLHSNRKSNSKSKDITHSSNGFDGFLSFWEVYPKKVEKQKVIKWFKSHKPKKELVDKMVSAIAVQKTGDQWQRGFIPNPLTWLNGGRWDDEVGAAAVAPDPKQFKSAEAYYNAKYADILNRGRT